MFYTAGLSLPDLAGAGGALAVLIALNRFGVRRLSPYLVIGLVLWVLVLRSGIHATLAGVMLAFSNATSREAISTICSPRRRTPHLLRHREIRHSARRPANKPRMCAAWAPDKGRIVIPIEDHAPAVRQ